jgi:predicted RNA-binding Zn-ribbon protein involved in translation (DUF1610 family)
MRVSATSEAKEDMAAFACPHCGNPVDAGRTWAQAAVSTLMAAPAVPDMATQVRCGTCGRVWAASDMRPGTAGNGSTSRRAVWVLVAALVAWAVSELFQR